MALELMLTIACRRAGGEDLSKYKAGTNVEQLQNFRRAGGESPPPLTPSIGLDLVLVDLLKRS
jgi:hypothetical protein